MYRIRHVLTVVFAVLFCIANGQNVSFALLSDDRERVEVPFRLVHNFIVVEVRLFGMLPMNFIFDTGAEQTILFNREIADFIGVEYDLRVPIMGADLSEPIYALVARSVAIEMRRLGVHTRDILVLEKNLVQFSQVAGEPIHGLLGGSYFGNSVVEIDYRRRKLVFHNTNTFTEPDKRFTELPSSIENNRIFIRGTTVLSDGIELGVKLLVDSGAGLPYLLHNNTHPSLTLPDEYIVGKLGYGLGGIVEGYLGRVRSVELGEIEFENVLTNFQDLDTTARNMEPDSTFQRNGLIGNIMLQRMAVVMDFMRGKMYVKPLRGFKRKFRMNHSGMIIFATGPDLNQYVVQSIVNNSPAEKAGIKVGDRLLRIQRMSTYNMTLDEVIAKLQRKEGKMLRVVVDRNGEVVKYKFRLTPMI